MKKVYTRVDVFDVLILYVKCIWLDTCWFMLLYVLLFSFLLIDLIVASELPDADEEGGSDGEAEFGAFTYNFLLIMITENECFLICISLSCSYNMR